jgi:hypothetical protein
VWLGVLGSARLLLTLVSAVGLLGVRFDGKGGVLGRRGWCGLVLLGVAVGDAWFSVVPLLVRECCSRVWGPGWVVWSWVADATRFPLTIVVYGFTLGELLIYRVRVGVGGVVLVEWVSPWLGTGTTEQVQWLTAAMLPIVVTVDLLVAMGAFVVVVVGDWVRGRVQPETSKGGFSPVAVKPGAPT